jgi:uncharacterized membrane protein
MTIAELGIFGTILLVGLLAGNELCALIIHVTLDRLPTTQSLAGSQAITRQLGQLMPIFMPITIIVTFAAGIGLKNVRSALLIAAGCTLAGMLIITLVGLRPLNDHELAATAETPETDWRSWRRKWVRLHSVRVGCDVAALVLVAVAAVIN